jgi:hypothetical protein
LRALLPVNLTHSTLGSTGRGKTPRKKMGKIIFNKRGGDPPHLYIIENIVFIVGLKVIL